MWNRTRPNDPTPLQDTGHHGALRFVQVRPTQRTEGRADGQADDAEREGWPVPELREAGDVWGAEVSKHIINSEIGLQTFIGQIRQLWHSRRYLEVKVTEGKARSVEQNAVIHGWFAQVARELREDDARGVKRFCKLHFGVPILRAEDDEFREAYDRTIKAWLTYEQKLEAMDILPVTSRMTTTQLDRCMADIQAHFSGRGVVLEYPKDRAA